MSAFVPNDIQRALFTEVMNASLSGSGDDLVDNAEVVLAWLEPLKPTLAALAGIGRAAVRNGTSDRETMMQDCMVAMLPLPHDTLRWLGEWPCLSDLVSPAALRGATDERCLANFRKLATLDQGL